MADNIVSNESTGGDAIKGGVFFGSNLTPGGVFSNLPLITTVNPPTTEQVKKLVLTLEQVKEELKKSAKLETGTEEDPLSDSSINTFLSTFVQLLIDYRDLRNFVFFGPSYTELVYHINTIIETYPYKSYFAQDVNIDPGIQITPFSGSRTRIAFRSIDVLELATYTYDSSGKTLWPNFDLIDKNKTRFPILAINAPLTISDATNATPIVITTTQDHNLVNSDSVIITDVLGNTAANGTFFVQVQTTTTFALYSDSLLTIPVVGTGPYISGGTLVLNNKITLMAQGNISANNLVESTPTITQLFKGLIVSPKQQVLTSFEVNAPGEQLALLSPLNPTPWPRELITNNIITSGLTFDNWIADAANMAPILAGEDLGVVSVDEGLNLRGALALDDLKTNQLLRRAVPERLVDELNDTEDQLFTRFILVAGRFFDFMKIYIDFLKYVHTLNYTEFNQLSPEFYKLYAEHYGFDLFDDENIDLAKAIIRTEPGLRYDNLDNPVFDNEAEAKTVKQLQAEKQKRLLINLFHLYKTKGTQKCIMFLTSLLGSPEGLIVLDEFAFDQSLGQRIVDNEKFHTPQIAYEIDPDYLVNPSNLNDPVNLPYVYRLKLDNDDIANLREINLATDPQAAIAVQIINFGKTIYPYGFCRHRSYANLQNPKAEYFMLPLNFPDKYYGITVEYMIPRDGYVKGGPGKNNDEVTYHLGSLYECAVISYDGSNNPIKLPGGAQYAYPVPPSLIDDSTLTTQPENLLQINAKNTFTISNLGPFGQVLEVFVNGVSIGSTVWNTTKKQTAFDLVNGINFSLTTPNYKATVVETLVNTFIITIEAPSGSGTSENGMLVEVKTNAVLDTTNIIGNSGTTAGGLDMLPVTNQFIISRIEGKDLVVRARIRDEYPSSLMYERVTIFQNIFSADALNHQLRLVFRPEGIEVYQDFRFQGTALWLDPTTATDGPFGCLDISKAEILTCSASVLPIQSIVAYPDKDDPSFTPDNTNPGDDTARWWDLLVGLPVNIDVFLQRVAVFDTLSIDMPDVLDFGIDPSGEEDEKWSFNFQDQAVDINNVKLQNQFDVKAIFRAPNPDAPETITVIEDFFINNYSDNKITDVSLLNQNYLNGKAQYIEDVQNFYSLPNGETVTVDSLFKFNAWSPTLHKDYTYEDFFNKAYRNYEIFSTQVLTYLTLLPFLELVESRFKSLVSQFIPIVINVSNFGRIIRNNPFHQLKVHYTNIHDICDGTQEESPARASFTITGGTYSPGVNSLEATIGPLYGIVSASNTSPIVITTANPHGFTVGNAAKITGVVGNAAANTPYGINWYVGVLNPFQFTLYSDIFVSVPVAGSGAYVSGGDVFIPAGFQDWQSQNTVVATNIAANALTTIPLPPFPLPPPLIDVTADQATVIYDASPSKFMAKFGVDINTMSLNVTVNGDVVVANVENFSGGVPLILGQDDCFVLTRSLASFVVPGGGPFIYFASENGPITYIYMDSEGNPPLYI